MININSLDFHCLQTMEAGPELNGTLATQDYTLTHTHSLWVFHFRLLQLPKDL